MSFSTVLQSTVGHKKIAYTTKMWVKGGYAWIGHI
jgi:hypothetical protein